MGKKQRAGRKRSGRWRSRPLRSPTPPYVRFRIRRFKWTTPELPMPIIFYLGSNIFVFYRDVRGLTCRCFWTRHRSPHFSSKRFGTAACIWEALSLYQGPLPPATAFFARSALTPSLTCFLYLVFGFFHCGHRSLRRRRRIHWSRVMKGCFTSVSRK